MFIAHDCWHLMVLFAMLFTMVLSCIIFVDCWDYPISLSDKQSSAVSVNCGRYLPVCNQLQRLLLVQNCYIDINCTFQLCLGVICLVVIPKKNIWHSYCGHFLPKVRCTTVNFQKHAACPTVNSHLWVHCNVIQYMVWPFLITSIGGIVLCVMLFRAFYRVLCTAVQ